MQARSHGGGEGGSAPLEIFEPPIGCAVPFAVTIGIEVYPPPPWNSVSPPPLLTIPGYGAAYMPGACMRMCGGS